jgi:DNA-binding HxlR family transcriptional regulator
MPAISKTTPTPVSTGSRGLALRKIRRRTRSGGHSPSVPAHQLPAALQRLATLLHRRWSVPVLAELQRGDSLPGGAKFISLVNRLAISRDSLKQTLDHLISLDYILRNPGVGHPMRPEYILAEDGYAIAPTCQLLMRLLERRKAIDLAFRKWSLPVIFAIGQGVHRFSELRDALPEITARALTLALKDLVNAGLVTRHVTEGYPPGSHYDLTAASRRLLPLLRAIAAR